MWSVAQIPNNVYSYFFSLPNASSAWVTRFYVLCTFWSDYFPEYTTYLALLLLWLRVFTDKQLVGGEGDDIDNMDWFVGYVSTKEQ